MKSGFQPKRKIVLAFGFDEEVSGIYVSQTELPDTNQLTRNCLQGAQELGKYLEATYGTDSFAMIVDEGGR